MNSLSEQIRDLANEMVIEGRYDLGLKAHAIADKIEEAIKTMEQPDYGDTVSALDFYYEGKMILKGDE